MTDERPGWARRMTNERKVRKWSQADTVRALKAHAAKDQPIHADNANLLRQWKRWEAGEVTPGEFYQPIIARTFDTTTHAMFPVPRKRNADTELLTIAGMDTLELVSRLQRSDMDAATLNGLRVLSDTLCSEYPVHARRPATHRGTGVARPDHPSSQPASYPPAASRGLGA